MSLFPKPFTVIRVTRALVRGVYVDGTPQTLTFQGSQGGTVQPLSGKDLQNLEPASRTIGKVWIRTTSELRTRTEGSLEKADVLVHAGKRWEVISDETYDNGLIPHHKYLAEYRGAA